MTEPTNHYEWAVHYIALGWPVFPCWPIRDGKCSCGKAKCKDAGKHPIGKLVPNGLKDATLDLKVVKGWLDKCPDANLAVPTGERSGVGVLDVDPREGGIETLLNLIDANGPLPDTPQQESGGGGAHTVFKYVPGLKNTVKKIGPGIDTRGEGGYFLVEPSNHLSGGVYTWEVSSLPGNVATAEIPTWLLTLWEAAQQPELTGAPAIVGKIPEGKRNDILASLAGTVRRRGLEEIEILNMLTSVNKRCDPPLPQTEVKKIAKSVAKYEPGDPILLEVDQIETQGIDLEFSTWEDIDRLLGPIEWDWEPWLPRGMTSIVASEPGLGKSGLVLRTAASVILGWDWPDGQQYTGELGSVCWCESEASQAINLDRAKKWGIPLDRLVSPLQNALMDFKLDNHDHKNALWSLAYRDDIRLIILDSLRGAHSRDENSSEVIGLVQMLAELARDTGKPILITHHLRKRGIFDLDGTPNLDRLRGSTAITQPARVVWVLDVPDPHYQPEDKRLSVIKNNLARFPEPIGMRINDRGVHFGDAPEPPQTYSELDRAVDFLKEILASEPVPAKDIYDEADNLGLSKMTVQRAKKSLSVISLKKGKWVWTLPPFDENGGKKA